MATQKNKALLIGINYTGTNNELRGCINDQTNILSYLKERFEHVNEVRLSGVSSRDSDDDISDGAACAGCLPQLPRLPCFGKDEKDDIKEKDGNKEKGLRDLHNIDMAKSTVDVLVLTDDQVGKHYPTKQNILNAFSWLIEGATSDSHLLFTYSGHGSHQRDYNGDEEDGQDESLVPADFQKVGCLIDDEVRRTLIDPLPEGCQLRVILDCCHSATGVDIRYCYRDFDFLKNASDCVHINQKQKDTKCDVISWSGCVDNSTSADAWIDGKSAGALTANFLKIMRNPDQDKSYHSVYAKLLTELRVQGYDQRPQLSSGKPIDLHAKFDLF
jgi:hypothetical protein